ncbi:MAG: DUF5590 domain-containing protein [Streptococcaceae bacterium]|jgi:uncharacterized protein YpmB|nr:DUF5590 domain-containing protein [Streptococcaceae bacterium]
MKKRRKVSLADQIMIGALSVILASFIAYFLFIQVAIGTTESTRNQLIKIAKSKTNLVKVETYNFVTTDKSYYSLTGIDANGNKIGVIVPENSGDISLVKLSDGVSSSSLPQTGATTIDLSLFKGQTVWEVNTKTTFKIYDFKTGKEI